MKEPSGEPLLFRVGLWVRQHRAPTMMIMLIVILSGVMLGQTWMLALGSMGLWFILYPGLAGSGGRKLPPLNTTAPPKSAQSDLAPANGDTLKPFSQYQEQMSHVLQMKHEIESAAGRIRDPRVRQNAVDAVNGLQELTESIYRLAALAEEARRKVAETGAQESRATEASITARLRRWDAQIDHAVSLFDTLLYEMLRLGADNRESQAGSLDAWSKMLRRETELLRSASAGGTG